MNESSLSKVVGKRLSLAILLSIVVHFVLLIILGLWTVYRYVQEGDDGMEVAMEKGEDAAVLEEVMEEVEVSEVQPEVEVDIDRLMVDPIHDVALPEIVADAVSVPTPPTPTVPSAVADRVSFTQATQRRAGSAFGSTEFFESSLVGTFYDVKQDREGKRRGINLPRGFRQELQRLHESGLSEEVFADFYKVPRKMYLTHLAVEKQEAQMATEVFDVEQYVEPRGWLIHYRGYIQPERRGTFRFVGAGDDVMMVYIDGEIVLEANWGHTAVGAWSQDRGEPSNHHNPFSGSENRYGDWIEFGNRPVRIDILFGENPGGRMGGALFVQEKGKRYETQSSGPDQPVLPLFATAPLLEEEVETIKGYKDDRERPLADNFRIDWNKPIMQVVRHVD
ncbi:MAG: hypothetical protein LAT58_08685 [Opitutales bacterium]|nr:hypothetical protein [Opitutales bacterium]